MTAVTSSCTRTRRTRSSTAPRCPRSSPRARPSSATTRSRSPTTTASTARSSSPTRPSTSGCARSPAPRSRSTDGAPRHAPLREPGAATRTSAGSSPTRTPARGVEGRERELLPAATTVEFVAAHAEGLVCLSGCARHGLGVVDPNAAARLARAFPGAFYVELQRPVRARRRAPQRRARRARRRARRPDGRDRRRPRAPSAPQRGSRTRSSRSATAPRSTAASASAAATTSPSSSRPQEMAERLPARRGRAHARGRRPLRLRPDPGARLPLPRLLRRPRPRRRPAPRDLRPRVRRPLRPSSQRPQARAHASGSSDELALIARLGLAGFFLLHWEVLELARECALEVRGPGSPRNAAAAGAGERLERRLDRLLPHRPLPRRPGRGEPLARPLPERRAASRCPTSTSTSRATSARS